MSVSLDYSEVSEFNKEMLELIQTKYPKEAKKFITKAGNAFRTEMKAGYRKHTIKRTGNLLRGVNRGRAYIYNGEDYQVRVYNKAPHAHLIEHGHKLYIKGKPTDKYVKGKHIVGNTILDFNSKFVALADKFIDDLLDRGFSG